MENKPRRPLVAHRRDLEDFEDVPRSGLTAPETVAETPDGPTAPFSFSGKRWPLFKIALVNALLTILTLGIYRFWAKTRLRRYFWSNIRIQNEPLEYTGTAMELLIGFLVVLAILVPVFAIYQGALFLAQSSPEWITMGLNVFYGIALLAFFQYAFYRMWRYRFSRTTWRGIRFTQGGSAWKYMGITLAWAVISVATLGIAYPWLRNAQWSYQIKNLDFGQTSFAYTGEAKELLKKWLIAIPLPLILISTLCTFYYESAYLLYIEINNSDGLDKETLIGLLENLIPAIGLLALLILYLGAAYIWYRVKEINHVIGQITLRSSSFITQIKPVQILITYIKFLSLVLIVPILFYGLYIFAIEHILFEYFYTENLKNTLILVSQYMVIASVIIIPFLLLPIATVVLLNFELVNKTFSSISLTAPDVLSEAQQPSSKTPEHGEGLADALDVGAF